MSATQFTVDLRDIRFVLFEQIRISEQLSGFERYAAFDKDIYETMVDEAAKLCTEVIAPLNKNSDREGCHFDGQGNVTTPKGFKEAWNTIAEGGWFGVSAPESFGGTGLPQTLSVYFMELMCGACSSLFMYIGLARAASNLLMHYAPESHRQLVVGKMVSGQWGGTMCLTEAGAGSAVGDNRCKATPTDRPGVYLLEGEKIFISGGDHDLAENIIHLVLARTPGAPSGTRGLSIFMVPKFKFDEQGNLGERNGAFVVGIEEKMGLHGNSTCTIALGANGPCEGILLGREGEGMPIMFHMMNEARIGVGVQALGGAASAYMNALSYAKERVQGTSLANMADADAERVTIVNHPDVRRMLMLQKVYVETMRSFLYTTALRLDRVEANADAEEAKYLLGLVELMVPICKSHCTDVGFEVCRLAIQTYGGYGYIGEYPVEQTMRDNKIYSIYEGTNGIQAMDLLGRKMRKGGGVLFMNWLGEANAEIERCRAAGLLPEVVTALDKAKDNLAGTAMHLGGLGMAGRLDAAMLQATPFLTQFGTVVLGLHALWQARVAHEVLASGQANGDEAFYKGKLANATFYAHNVLPQAVALGKSIQSGDESCMDPVLFG